MTDDAMPPERAAHLRRAITAIAAAVTAQMLEEVGSTESGWVERLIRPQLPRLRELLLSRLSEADPVAIERLLGATAWLCEAILADAPGDPLPRCRPEWNPDGRLVLVPDA